MSLTCGSHAWGPTLQWAQVMIRGGLWTPPPQDRQALLVAQWHDLGPRPYTKRWTRSSPHLPWTLHWMECYLMPICCVLSDTSLERSTSPETRSWTLKMEKKSTSWRTPLRAGTAGLLTPALPASRCRHCRPLLLKTWRRPRPALPAQDQRHCRPHRHYRPKLTGTAGPTSVDFITAVDFPSMDQDNLCNAHFTPVRIWTYKYLLPSSRLGLDLIWTKTWAMLSTLVGTLPRS